MHSSETNPYHQGYPTLNELAILQAAEKYDQPGSLHPEAEEAYADYEGQISEENHAHARRVTGLAMELTEKAEKNRRKPEKRSTQEISGMTTPEIQALAMLPTRLFLTKDEILKFRQFKDIVKGIGDGVKKSEALPFMDKLKLQLAANLPERIWGLPEKQMLWAINTAMNMAQKHILGKVGAFVGVFPDGTTAEEMKQFADSQLPEGIGFESNFVVEAAKTAGDVKKNIKIYQDMIVAGYDRIAVKPTALAVSSTNAIVTEKSKESLKESLMILFRTAHYHRLKNGETCEITVDSEQAELLDFTREAWFEASMEFPEVRTKMAAQMYMPDTEKRLITPTLEQSKERLVLPNAVPMGNRIVNGANEIGESQVASRNGWLHPDGKPRIQIVDGRKKAHANYLQMISKLAPEVANGNYTMTVASMNPQTQVHALLKLAELGVLSQQPGAAVFASLRGMLGDEFFKVVYDQFNVGIEDILGEGKNEEDLMTIFFVYFPKIFMSIVEKFFNYYLRRTQEIAGLDRDARTASVVGILARHGINSTEFIQTQVRFGLLEAVREMEGTEYPLAPAEWCNRGPHENFPSPQNLNEFRPFANPTWGSVETRAWGQKIIQECKERKYKDREIISFDWEIDKIIIDDKDNKTITVKKCKGFSGEREIIELKGHTRPDLVLGEVEYATEEDINYIIQEAEKFAKNWHENTKEDHEKYHSLEKRIEVVLNVAQQIGLDRNTLVKHMMLDPISESVAEADMEVNETGDFANLAALLAKKFAADRPWLKPVMDGNNVAVKNCPKNFPVAIPAIHILTNYLNGKVTLVKPSTGEDEECVLSTYKLCQSLWAAGVPPEAVVFVPCNNANSQYLATHEKINDVGHTGSEYVGKEKIRRNNPKAKCKMEQGGTNIAIVDGTNNLEDVAKSCMYSKNGRGGQKCSKTRIIACTEDVDFDKFIELCGGIDDVMCVETPLDIGTDCTPLTKITPEMQAKIYTLRQGEEWLREPKKPGDPGIRIVRAANYHKFKPEETEEIFAPIVTIIQVPGGIEEAVDFGNKLPGATTSGIYSTNIDGNVQYAIDNLKTGGTFYANDSITGCPAHLGFGNGSGTAVGGMRGLKTGTMEFHAASGAYEMAEGEHAYYDLDAIGPDETGLGALLTWLQGDFINYEGHPPEFKTELQKVIHSGWSSMYENATYFSQKRKPPYETIGQDEWIESNPIGRYVVRISEGDQMSDWLPKIFAVVASGNPLEISIDYGSTMTEFENFLGISFDEYFPNTSYVVESAEELCDRIKENNDVDEDQKIMGMCVSHADALPDSVFIEANEVDLNINQHTMVGDGFVDAVNLSLFNQRSYSIVYHVHGDTHFEDLKRAVKEEERQALQAEQDTQILREHYKYTVDDDAPPLGGTLWPYTWPWKKKEEAPSNESIDQQQ